MIVELRKVKINKSIFNQLFKPSFPELLKENCYEVLGWAYDKNRYILLYFNETNSLNKMPFLSEMKIDERRPNVVYFKLLGYAGLVELPSYSDSIKWIAKLNEIQSEARIKGQIFI